VRKREKVRENQSESKGWTGGRQLNEMKQAGRGEEGHIKENSEK